jgi:hypothetical protein
MKNLPDAGFHWRADADGTILYRANEDAPTYVISRTELQRITHAAEYVAAALFASIVFTFVCNGNWWLAGFRTPEFAALITFIMVIPAVLIGNYAIVRHRVLSKAPVAARQIEIYALTESLSLAMRYLTRPVASLWLWLVNAALVIVGCEIAIMTIRFLRRPVMEYAGSHQPGPLDGMFYLAFVLTLVYLVTDELFRRKREKAGA